MASKPENSSFKRLSNEIQKAFKKLHSKKKYHPDDINEYTGLVEATNDLFESALNKGLSDNVIPNRMAQSLKKDVFLFSALKTHAELFEASRLLTDNNGKIKSFREFNQDVKKLKSNYNKAYLNAEYQFAVSSAQQASNWTDFEADGDRYNLQYRTAGDASVRESHESLRDITLPLNDPFWEKYFPPNGWRCRCTAVQVRKSKVEVSDSKRAITAGNRATTQLGKNGKNKLEIFRFNPGQSKIIFPKNHPYRKVAGANKIVENKKLGFKTAVEFPNGGSVAIHREVNRNGSDFTAVYDSCYAFAKKGFETRVTPAMNSTLTHRKKDYDAIYGDLKGTKFYGKCPDFWVDGRFYEHEGFSSKKPKNALRNMMSHGLEQSNRLVIEKPLLSDKHITHNISMRVENGQDIQEVWIKDKDDLRQVYKRQMPNNK